MKDSLEHLSEILPDNFFVSENLLPANMVPFSQHQKPFEHLLVIQKGNDPTHRQNPVVIAVDPKESAILKKTHHSIRRKR